TLWGQRTGIELATTYSHTASRRTTIGAGAFHFRVRDGNGWFHAAVVTRGPEMGQKKVLSPDFWRPESLGLGCLRLWSFSKINLFGFQGRNSLTTAYKREAN